MKKVRIYKPHTHAGKRLVPGPEGIELEVSDQVAKFLHDQKLTTPPEKGPAKPEALMGAGERGALPPIGN